MHQDHGATPSDCKECMDLGFSSVMMDGSLLEDQKTPSSFEYNIKVTKKTVEFAHTVGVSVEGEIGWLGSLESGIVALGLSGFYVQFINGIMITAAVTIYAIIQRKKN